MKVIYTLVIAVLVTACAKSPEEKYLQSIENYKSEKSNEVKKEITKNLFNFISIYKFKASEEYSAFSNTIYVKQKNIGKFVTVDGNSYTVNYYVKYADYDLKNNLLAFSDGVNLELISFKRENAETENFEPKKLFSFIMGNEKNNITSLNISGNRVLYVLKGSLNFIDIETMVNDKLFPKKKMEPPYKKNAFNTNIFVRDNKIAVILGNAGLYNLYMYNLDDGSSVINGKKISTPVLYFDSTVCQYLEGTSGEWVISRYDYLSKKAIIVKKITSLQKISYSGEVVFYSTGEAGFIEDSAFTKSLVSPYKIKNIFNKHLIIQRGKTLHIVETNQYFKEIEKIRSAYSDFF